MILKFNYEVRDNKFNYKYVNCKLLKCNVDNVAYFKDENVSGNKYFAFDIPSGMLLTREKNKKDLIDKINSCKNKLDNIRTSDYYNKEIERKENTQTTNTIEEVENEIKLLQAEKEKEKAKDESIKIIISESNFKAKVWHLKDDMYLYHKSGDENFKGSNNLRYRLAIKYKNDLIDTGINSIVQFKNGYNFENAINETIRLIEKQNFDCTIDSFIQETIKMIEDKKWVHNWILSIIKDYDEENDTNYYIQGMQVKEEIRELRRKEELERKQKDEEKEKLFLEEKQKELDTIVDNAINIMKQDDKTYIINKKLYIYKDDRYDYKVTNLLNYLFEKYNIDIPIKIKGLINNNGVYSFTRNSYRGRNSKVILKYLNELYDKVMEEN